MSFGTTRWFLNRESVVPCSFTSLMPFAMNANLSEAWRSERYSVRDEGNARKCLLFRSTRWLISTWWAEPNRSDSFLLRPASTTRTIASKGPSGPRSRAVRTLFFYFSCLHCCVLALQRCRSNNSPCSKWTARCWRRVTLSKSSSHECLVSMLFLCVLIRQKDWINYSVLKHLSRYTPKDVVWGHIRHLKSAKSLGLLLSFSCCAPIRHLPVLRFQEHSLLCVHSSRLLLLQDWTERTTGNRPRSTNVWWAWKICSRKWSPGSAKRTKPKKVSHCSFFESDTSKIWTNIRDLIMTRSIYVEIALHFRSRSSRSWCLTRSIRSSSATRSSSSTTAPDSSLAQM